jgi:single-stranded-DNA-specific exonuclease
VSGASLESAQRAAIDDPGPASDSALVLAREAGLSLTVADALHRRGFEAGPELSKWLDPKLSHLTNPAGMADLDAAADRIARAIKAREPIAVFGDYDCDGITSCAIMTEVIRTLGGEVTPHLASRFAGGYGFSAPALERVKDGGARLLVTCDCGSSDHERLEAARVAGIDTVVIDHHLVPKETLPAVAFLNPHRPDCEFPYKGLASCGLALFVATALRKVMGQKLDVRRWLDLVAVGTVADVAPLDGDNRALVSSGLAWISSGERVGLRAMALNGSRGKRHPISAENVAYQIAPRINAPGRLGDPRLALDALMARDAATAHELAERVEQTTLSRRKLQREMIDEALKIIAERDYAADPAIVLAGDWNPGVVGIVAGRVADQFGKPCVVIALEGKSGRGSARAPTGFQLYDALTRCSAELLGFGGHQAAAGLEVASDGIDRFRDVFNDACGAQLADMPPVAASYQPHVRLDERDDLRQVLADLDRLEPCGEANPAPRLLIADAKIGSAREIKGHLKLNLELKGQQLGGFAPERGAMADALPGKQLDLVARLKHDHWRGGDAMELLVEALLFDNPRQP